MAIQTLQKFFDSHPDVSFIRLIVMDHSSVLRVSVLPKEATLDVAKHGSFNSPVSGFICGFTTFDGFNWDALQPGVDKIIPDWTSLKICTFYPTHAMVMCAIQEPPVEIREAGKKKEDSSAKGTASEQTSSKTQDDERPKEAVVNDGFDLCPRTILAKQVERANAASQDILVGIELEFLLYKPGMDFTRPRPNSSFNTTVLYNQNITRVVDDIAISLVKADIKILKYHPEGGIDGIFEIVLPPYAPIQAADAMVYSRETIKNIAQKHGYEVTLSPSPFEKGSGLGAHTSISISDTSDGKADSFLAGILESFLAIGAFAMPSVQSGRRIANGIAIKPVRWGRDNKACVVRERRTGLWEIRCPDATMNPYLAIAALIATGISGIESKKELTMKPQLRPTFKITDEEKVELGIKDMIPDSLDPLLAALKTNDVLKTTMGDRLIKVYTGLKEKEIEAGNSMSVQEISERLRTVF